MQTAITHDVKIVVETAYQQPKEVDGRMQHMFAYRITIQNMGEYTLKLMRRHWHIFDALQGHSEVEGEGVVGQQPVLEPGETHQYVSGCMLASGTGRMYGTYLMERQLDGKKIEVKIPEFVMVVPALLN